MIASEDCLKLIQHFEGMHDGDKKKPLLQPQMDSVGIWTVGWGHALTNKTNGRYLKGQTNYKLVEKQYPEFLNLTEQQAEELLKKDLEIKEKEVEKWLRVPLRQNEYDALMAFVYNAGYSDSLFRMINNHFDTDKITAWWKTHYITSQGKALNGLIRRRKAEAHLFETGELKFFE